MTSQEILRKYLEYYQERGNVLIPNLSLVPEGDSTLLFVNSGMFPLVPYLFGEPHPLGSRLVSIQRAVRFDDLEEVGDNRHTTVFHMIGNWSLGDYFKKEQLPWIWEFFVKELGLNINKMYGTVFSGDQYAERDVTSIALLKEIFVSYGIEDPKEGERIFAYAGNWWQRGDAIGELGGPDSEVFYYIGEDGTGLGMDPETDEDKFIEIGNTVFLQFKRTEEGWEELPQKNVDFGGGFERIAMVVQGKNDIFETDNFWPIIQKIQELSGKDYYGDKGVQRIMRILADHIRSATFISMDGVVPGNKDQGYVLRRFLRRMVRFARKLDISKNVAGSLVLTVATMFEWIYPDLPSKQWFIIGVFTEEEEKFSKTLERGQKESVKRLDGFSGSVEALAAIAFDLYQSVGYPPEMVLEDAQDNGVEIDLSTFENTYAEYVTKHQEKSRKGAEQKFAGGLADHSEQVVKYHTTTHLLNKALRDIFGDQIMQRGSNITGERLRFDYNHDAPLTEEQIAKIEEIVNKHISENLPVNFEMMPIADAEKTGAIHAFGEKYGDTVKIYYIGDSLDRAISKEFCGGPHVSNTSELSPIEIYKQQSVGKGIRRVYVREEVIRNS